MTWALSFLSARASLGVTVTCAEETLSCMSRASRNDAGRHERRSRRVTGGWRKASARFPIGFLYRLNRCAACRGAAALLTLCLCGCQTLQPDPSAAPDQAIGRMPGHCLERIYLRCSREATERRLDFGEVAACSMVYETLLKNRFGGDFHALLAWSRAQSDESAGAAGYDGCW